MGGFFAIFRKYKQVRLPSNDVIQECYRAIKHQGPSFNSLVVTDDYALGSSSTSQRSNDSGNRLFEVDKTKSVCHGEIYNWTELVDTHAITLKGESECEVLCHLFNKHGDSFDYNNVDGVFSCVHVREPSDAEVERMNAAVERQIADDERIRNEAVAEARRRHEDPNDDFDWNDNYDYDDDSYDDIEDELGMDFFAVRDPVGFSPLFYLESYGYTAFATDAAALACLHGTVSVFPMGSVWSNGTFTKGYTSLERYRRRIRQM